MLDKSATKDSSRSDASAPSMLSSVSGFSSGSSSFWYGSSIADVPSAYSAPLHSVTRGTNFTSTIDDQSRADNNTESRFNSSVPLAEDYASESFNSTFRHFRTPANDPGMPFSDMVITASPLSSQASKRDMVFILLSLFIGTVVGGLLKHMEIDKATAQWIMTPGHLFMRAVQCVVVPMVFVNLVVATADMMHKKLGKHLSFRLPFALLTSMVVAIGLGLATAVIMHSVFSSYRQDESNVSTDAIFGIQCGNGKYLEAGEDGVVTCSATKISATSRFALDDINSALVRNEALTGTNTTLSDNVLSIISQAVPMNIVAAFVSSTLLSIAAFALPLGATLAYSFHGPASLNPLLEFFREVNETLVHMVHYILRFTPFAVLSLLAGSIATSLEDSVADEPLKLVMIVVATVAATVLVHMLVVVPVLFMLVTRRNPFCFMLQMLPVYVYSIGCSSSMATMPLSLQIIETSRQVTSPIMHFVLSVGTSLHMPGTSIYLAVLVHFLADVAGIAHAQSVSKMLVTFLGVLLCTITAPPIPSGALTVLTATWNIIFAEYAIPDNLYALVLASDVLLDRFVTLCNVNAQAMLCHILADQLGPQDMKNVPRARTQQHAAQ
uniref:Amino acid transporter n=1 Tax=Hyaloperonospora arabidopsidis (strain Emoy2) TaxID=559515 RepID=M4BBK4_HYAAE